MVRIRQLVADKNACCFRGQGLTFVGFGSNKRYSPNPEYAVIDTVSFQVLEEGLGHRHCYTRDEVLHAVEAAEQHS